MNGSFTQLYFGAKRDKEITQKQLSQVDRSLNLNLCSQFLHDYHSRYSKYAFKAFDKDGSGLISTDDFCDMIFSIKVKTWTIQRNVKLLQLPAPPPHCEAQEGL